VIVTSSVQSFVAERYKAAYVAAKHAVAGVVRTASVEGVAVGLTVNAVAPGWMMTNMTEVQIADLSRVHGLSRDELVAKWSAAAPDGRPIDPHEVAEVVAFLASERSSGINGVVLPVDLGILASYFE
jgi:3-hydroxybutyrate dehydrogenase